MEAPLYRVGLGYVLPTEAFSLNMAFCMESRSWKSDSPLVVAPADSAAWEYRAGAEYRLGRVVWSSAPFAGDAGWSFSGGYRVVRRWGYRPWGVVGTLFTHDGAPQHQMHLAAAFGTELGDGERPRLLRLSVRRERVFNSYERNRPRYGHAGIPFMTGVSGYIPESLPGDDSLAAAVCLALSPGEGVLAALRFDWLHRYDEGDERRGAGLWINFPAGKDSRVVLSAGAAFDSPSGTALPFTGSLTWTKNIGIGKEKQGYGQ